MSYEYILLSEEGHEHWCEKDNVVKCDYFRTSYVGQLVWLCVIISLSFIILFYLLRGVYKLYMLVNV